MTTFQRVPALAFAVLAVLFVTALNARGQVTTATLYGVVRDTSGAILPGVNVTVTHQGTSLTRETVTDDRGEFALPALPAGPYAIKIELSGFKTYTSEGLKLGAGQEVRQTYALEVGAIAETVTVVEQAPLIQTASTAQVQTMWRRGDRDPGLPEESAERPHAGLGCQFDRYGRWGRPGVSRERRRRRRQRHHGGRQQRPNQPGKPRLRQLRRPEPDRDPERRGGRRGAGRQGRAGGGVRRFDRRAGQHDHAIGDQPVPRIAAGKLPERSVLVEKSVFARHDPQTKHHVQPVRRIVGRAHPAEPGLVLHQL